MTGQFQVVLASVALTAVIRASFNLTKSYMASNKLIFFNTVLNFSATAITGVLNIYFMRRKELNEGIMLQSKDGK